MAWTTRKGQKQPPFQRREHKSAGDTAKEAENEKGLVLRPCVSELWACEEMTAWSLKSAWPSLAMETAHTDAHVITCLLNDQRCLVCIFYIKIRSMGSSRTTKPDTGCAYLPAPYSHTWTHYFVSLHSHYSQLDLTYTHTHSHWHEAA